MIASLDSMGPLAIVAFFLVTASSYFLLHNCDRRNWTIRSRLGEIQRAGAKERKEKASQARGEFASRLFLACKLDAIVRVHEQKRLKQRIGNAGIQSRNAIQALITIRYTLTIAPVLLSAICWFSGACSPVHAIYVSLLGCPFGWLLPALWLDRAVKRYQRTLCASIPDFLDLVVVCLDAGLSLQDSLRRVTIEMQSTHPLLASELTLVYRDVEHGAPLGQAMRRFSERSGYDAIRVLSSLIGEAQKHGTNIADAFRDHADSLRYHREQAAEETAQKASVKIVLPMMLCVFPATFIVLVGPAAIQIYEAFSKP